MKTLLRKRCNYSKKISLFFIAVIMVFAVPIALFSNISDARDYEAEIAAKEQQIAQFQAEAARLAAQADSLAVRLAEITNERNQLQVQIDISQSKYDQLVTQIAQTNIDIQNNRDALGTIIADLHVDDNIAPIEMIFSSKNISEYMDKQEYRNSIRNDLSLKITKIKNLKAQLETQEQEQGAVLNDLKSQRDNLLTKEKEQQDLISATRGEEQAYQALSQQSQAEKRQLEIEQQAALAALLGEYNISSGDPNKGGYPDEYANVPYWAGPNDNGWYWEVEVPDKWGMFARQCVSYAAWKVHQSYLLGTSDRDMPYWGGRGNANEWPDDAWSDGIPVSSTPSKNTVGVSMNGAWGHVVWVESVNADGSINISQYNYCAGDCGNGGSGRGLYSEMYNLPPDTFSYYIDF